MAGKRLKSSFLIVYFVVLAPILTHPLIHIYKTLFILIHDNDFANMFSQTDNSVYYFLGIIN